MARRRLPTGGRPTKPAGRRVGRPLVGLFVETGTSAGREILAGIARYVRNNGPWDLHLDPRPQIYDPNWMPLWLDRWRGTGLIARVQSPSLAAAMAATGVPVVDVLGEAGREPADGASEGATLFESISAGRKGSPSQRAGFPLVCPDDAALGRLAAEHLLDRRFQHFAYVGVRGAGWSARRRRAFAAVVAQHGCHCEVLEEEAGSLDDDAWDRFIDIAADAIRGWPKPLGLMLGDDHLAPQVAQACERASAAVPEDVAVVGVGNDEPVCMAFNPPLSSVDANHAEVGYRAALLLDRLMNGAIAPEAARRASPVLVGPRTVVERPSSGASAIGDPLVAAALQRIREEACRGVQVADIAERLEISRSALQRRFRAAMGRSVHDEIVRVQIQRAKELLLDSSLSLGEVADRAGFNHREYMGSVFKARLGQTPGQFRRAARQA